MSDALTDINDNGAEEDAHGRHRGHGSDDDAQENGHAGHGRHRRGE
jgi:hypothetical protein